MELFQHIEETRCGMFESKLAAEPKVSFERDDLTCQMLVTFLREEMAQPCCREWNHRARSGKTGEVLSDDAVVNTYRSNKRSAESSV